MIKKVHLKRWTYSAILNIWAAQKHDVGRLQ